MEKTFHMLLYRAAHAERNYLRPYLAAIGLEVGQPKILGYLEPTAPAGKANWPIILISIPRRYPGCWIQWKKAG